MRNNIDWATIIYIIILFMILIFAVLLTKWIIESDLPIWIKFIILK